MANFSIKTDLLKLKGAFVTNLKGKTATKRCLIIPVDDAGLFIGGMKQLERQATEMPVTGMVDGTQAFTDDDLPF